MRANRQPPIANRWLQALSSPLSEICSITGIKVQSFQSRKLPLDHHLGIGAGAAADAGFFTDSELMFGLLKQIGQLREQAFKRYLIKAIYLWVVKALSCASAIRTGWKV